MYIISQKMLEEEKNKGTSADVKSPSLSLADSGPYYLYPQRNRWKIELDVKLRARHILVNLLAHWSKFSQYSHTILNWSDIDRHKKRTRIAC